MLRSAYTTTCPPKQSGRANRTQEPAVPQTVLDAPAMTSSASSPPHLSHNRSCRVVRNPALLLVIALVYALSLLAFRGGDGPRFMALRGSTAANDVTEVAAGEAAQNWEPENRNPGTSYGVSARGPVKGGVEIYPVQVRCVLRFGWTKLATWYHMCQRHQFLTYLVPGTVYRCTSIRRWPGKCSTLGSKCNLRHNGTSCTCQVLVYMYHL